VLEGGLLRKGESSLQQVDVVGHEGVVGLRTVAEGAGDRC
jgi:hypothetical protein